MGDERFLRIIITITLLVYLLILLGSSNSNSICSK